MAGSYSVECVARHAQWAFFAGSDRPEGRLRSWFAAT
jgi:hypothetical protein